MSTAGQHVILVQHVLFERVKFVGNVSHGHTCLKNSHALFFLGGSDLFRCSGRKKVFEKGQEGRGEEEKEALLGLV